MKGYGPADPLQSPRFAGISTFLRLPHTLHLDGVDVAFVGLPFDTGVTFRAGARFGPKAIREGWDATRCELEILRASRPKAPAALSPNNGVNAAVLEAACVLTAKLDQPEKLFDEPTLDAAEKRFRGGIGL